MSAKRSSVKITKAARAGAPRLRERRRQGRRRMLGLALILFLLVLAALLYGLTQPALRISHVRVEGADEASAARMQAQAMQALTGSYYGIIPHNSVMFFAERRVRTMVLAGHLEFAAASIAHEGLTGLVIRVSPRTAVGQWCGLAPTPGLPAQAGVTPYCYLYDPLGFIYAAVPGQDVAVIDASTATTTDATSSPQADATSAASSAAFVPPAPDIKTINAFTLYAPLVNNVQEPLGATLAHAAQLPDAFAFARQVANLGSEVRAIVVRGDEADLLLASGTRVTYVLGHEQEAYAALLSAKSDLNLASGALDYVDLRFPGKVYLKKKGE